MLRAITIAAVGILSAAGPHAPKSAERHEMFYTITGNDVLLWREPLGSGCILATGRRHVLEKLRSSAITGRAQFVVERLPAPSLEPLPPGIIVNDRTVRVRGVAVEPQCDESKDLYWIVGFRFLGAYAWRGGNQLVPQPPSAR